MTAQEYLAGLKQLTEAATEGPWEVVKEYHKCWLDDEDFCLHRDSPITERELFAPSDGYPHGFVSHTHESFDAHQIAPDVAGNYDYEDGGIIRNEDAEFIAASRQAVPRLIAALEAVLEVCSEAEDQENRDDWTVGRAVLAKRVRGVIETALGEEK